jgi:manganese oxidase
MKPKHQNGHLKARRPLGRAPLLLLILFVMCGAASAQETAPTKATMTTSPTVEPSEPQVSPTPSPYVDEPMVEPTPTQPVSPSDDVVYPYPEPEPQPQPYPVTTLPECKRVITADVVALDQPMVYNRLGAMNPAGMMFALRNDVQPIDSGSGLVAGNVTLKDYKRPRPLTLRMNVGDCLQILFQNLLSAVRTDEDQPNTRSASVHVAGLQLVNSIGDDGSNVGQNASSLVSPGGSATYTLYAQREGSHLLYSTAATTGGQGDGGSISMGLFGAVNVEPAGAEWYRSQLTKADMQAATRARTAGNQPVINYDAVYTSGPRAGLPILKILDANNRIVHSDLNAIITGPNKGRFPAGTYRPNATSPDRDQPFREFTVVYHDEVKAVQAFPKFFEDPVLGHTLYSVKDGFAINYGIAGIGSEILANRLKVGPMKDCTECLYEDFFLSAWAVGDPAQLVDIPANASNPAAGILATKVLFPDDPSNVHHSYLNDHVKMRVLHAGPKEHHIHHLHAHQWLRTPDDDNSSYLDSQALGPGYAFTTEISHGGTGNRNRTPGDSIFHCHFYPHFAQGMWELWRAHDVFEEGTALNADGTVAAGARALPDGEIKAGTPIPALVPVPTIAMAPAPTAAFQGFPFYIPGVAGHRPPHPPLDTVDDGGLQRHVIVGGTFTEVHNRLDFSKDLITAIAVPIDEAGTATEKAAMAFHAAKSHATYLPDGTSGAQFRTNGLPAQPGAPFADPCVSDAQLATGTPRTYKAANIQIDMKINKAGWHVPQARILTLWGDVEATRLGKRAPEPFFFRANTGDCITFHHTNLVPRYYELDDFQVRTPTDIMGQHIHLVKFDVTSSDGAGNGFNYEDGTFSPEEVIERIHAIRKQNSCVGVDRGDPRDGTFTCPVAKAHPTLGTLGAQTTIQRWYADDTLNNNGKDRTLRTVFSHDHFGPSTHQQTGLYAGLVVEPKGSKWRHSETGVFFGGEGVAPRFDGGPTTWRADIITADQSKSYREFLLAFADFQLAYEAGGGINSAGKPIPDTPRAISPPFKDEVGLPYLVRKANICPGGVPLPCPEAVSASDPGTMSVNYRNEPVALRVRNPSNNTQASGIAGDLSHVYRSNVSRADWRLNSQPTFYPALTAGVQPGDPFTPLLRAYEDDLVQVRILVGGHEEGHNFEVQGIKWKFEPGTPDDPVADANNNSGYRNNQMMGISEHYEFIVPKLPKNFTGSTADYLYRPGASVDDQWNGLWGIMRAYKSNRQDLARLPNNTTGGQSFSNPGDFNGVCPKAATVQPFYVTAALARDILPEKTLIYNSRDANGGKLHDPTAIMFVRNTDLDRYGRLRSGVPREPLVLRARAGECIEVTLTNRLPSSGAIDLPGYNTMPMIVENFNANQVKPSSEVGLHPQNLFTDVTRYNGVNVGLNPVQTIRPGYSKKYQWYAGDVTPDAYNRAIFRGIEFGATGLTSSDPIKHSNKGAFGSLVIEPAGSAWSEDYKSRAQATVTKPDGTSFREFVMMFQNDVNLRYSGFNSLSDSYDRSYTADSDGAAYTADSGGTSLDSYAGEADTVDTTYEEQPVDPADTAPDATPAEPVPTDTTEPAPTTDSDGVASSDDTASTSGYAYPSSTYYKTPRGIAVPNLAGDEDAEDSGQKAVNYRTEPLWKRMGYAPDTPLNSESEPGEEPDTRTPTRDYDFTNVLSNSQIGGLDPETPVFTATAGQDVRIRLLQPTGHARNNAFMLHGHIWEEEPYTNNSAALGSNPLSEWKGAQYGIGPGSHFDFLLKNGAGGAFRVPGDYLYRTFQSFQFDGGIWGIFRVAPAYKRTYECYGCVQPVAEAY